MLLLNIDKQTSVLVLKAVHTSYLFCPTSYVLVEKVIGQIVESERGNKQYFNLGPILIIIMSQ
jgi:hypothetical protein